VTGEKQFKVDLLFLLYLLQNFSYLTGKCAGRTPLVKVVVEKNTFNMLEGHQHL
jgi:hypothetical protein